MSRPLDKTTLVFGCSSKDPTSISLLLLLELFRDVNFYCSSSSRSVPICASHIGPSRHRSKFYWPNELTLKLASIGAKLYLIDARNKKNV
jgi:hypothetical protein